MRAHFGGYFFGQAGTFVYLTEAMRSAPQFDANFWPQFSLYNLIVANFWPLYWVGHFADKVKADEIYWHVFDVAHGQAAYLFQLFDLVTKTAR